MEIRLQKVLAQAGVASRRKAEELISAGRVEVNGQVVTEQGTKVEPTRDLVRVDGRLLKDTEAKVYFILYKPQGMVTTLSDPEGRATILDCLQGIEERVFAVGRLDYDAEGALLITNDGDLANRLMHPKYEVPRVYLAKVKGEPDEATIRKLRVDGVLLEDGLAKPDAVELQSRTERNTWIKLVLSEGRPHLVKRLCAAIGHPVVRLFRPSFGGVNVEGMKPGRFRPLRASEIERLQHAGAGSGVTKGEVRLPPRRHRVEEAVPEQEPVGERVARKWKEAESVGAGRSARGAPVRSGRSPRGGEGAARSGRPARTRGERPARFGQAERGERPARSGQSERGERPARFGQSDRAERPARFGQSDRGERPARSGQSERGERPARSGRSERVERPARSGQSERGERPARSGQSERGTRPAGSGQSERGERPAGSERGARPARAARPGGPGRREQRPTDAGPSRGPKRPPQGAGGRRPKR